MDPVRYVVRYVLSRITVIHIHNFYTFGVNITLARIAAIYGQAVT
jgi:hypothetical protein